MVLSVELTYYPFKEDYIPAIKQTIAHLNSFEGLKVRTFPTATIIMGPYDTVMDAIKNTVAWCYQQFGKSVFVAKFLPEVKALDE